MDPIVQHGRKPVPGRVAALGCPSGDHSDGQLALPTPDMTRDIPGSPA
jgi:hypothetical protein